MLNVPINPDIEQKIIHAIKAGGYESAEEVVNEALQAVLGEDDDMRLLADAGWTPESLERALLKGARSPAEPATEETWKNIRQELQRRRENRKS